MFARDAPKSSFQRNCTKIVTLKKPTTILKQGIQILSTIYFFPINCAAFFFTRIKRNNIIAPSPATSSQATKAVFITAPYTCTCTIAPPPHGFHCCVSPKTHWGRYVRFGTPKRFGFFHLITNLVSSSIYVWSMRVGVMGTRPWCSPYYMKVNYFHSRSTFSSFSHNPIDALWFLHTPREWWAWPPPPPPRGGGAWPPPPPLLQGVVGLTLPPPPPPGPQEVFKV